MKEKLIDLDTAKLAKEKGFDIKCDNFYHGDNTLTNDPLGRTASGEITEAPTQSLLQKWLREQHKINIEIRIWSCSAPTDYSYSASVWDKPYSQLKEDNAFFKYEESLEVGLQDALKAIET